MVNWKGVSFVIAVVIVACTGSPKTLAASTRWMADKPAETIIAKPWVDSIAFSTDGKALAIAGVSAPLTIWSTRSWKQILQLDDGRAGGVVALCYFRKSHFLAAAFFDGQIVTWTTRDWKKSGSFALRAYTSPYQLSYSATGDSLVTGNDPIQVLQPSTGSEIRRYKAYGVTVNAAVSPDGKLLAIPDHRDIRIVDIHGGQTVSVIRHNMAADSWAYSPDGRQFAVAGIGGAISVWNPYDGTLIKRINGLPRHVQIVKYAPVGHLLVSLSMDSTGPLDDRSLDGTVRLWNSETWKLIKVIHANRNYVSSIAFTDNGGLLATGSTDGTVKIWNIKSIVSGTETNPRR